MSGQTGGYEDDPYVWIQQGRTPTADPKEVDYQNPAKAFFDGMADFVLTLDKEGTKAPEGTRTFIMGEGVGSLIESTAGPNPALAIGAGEAQATTETTAFQGVEGYNTFVQLIMDKSEGMNAPAGTFNGISLKKSDLARALAAIMVEQARGCGSHFAIYSYDTMGYVEWAGPSKDYDGALEYLLASNSTAFVPGGDALQSAGMQFAIDGCRGGIPTSDGGSSEEIHRAVTISFSDTCYDWSRQHWQTVDWKTGRPLDMVLRDMGPVFYVGVGSTGAEDQIVPYYGGVMRNTGGGRDYNTSAYRARAGTSINNWVYFPGTMRLQAEDCYSSFGGINLPKEVRQSRNKPSIPKWPHLGVDMQQFFKAVMLAPDRGDGMMHLAGSFGAMVRLTHPDGDYS